MENDLLDKLKRQLLDNREGISYTKSPKEKKKLTESSINIYFSNIRFIEKMINGKNQFRFINDLDFLDDAEEVMQIFLDEKKTIPTQLN